MAIYYAKKWSFVLHGTEEHLSKVFFRPKTKCLFLRHIFFHFLTQMNKNLISQPLEKENKTTIIDFSRFPCFLIFCFANCVSYS